jgi:hypothetical protein
VRSQAAKRQEGCRIANEVLTVLFMVIASCDANGGVGGWWGFCGIRTNLLF